MGLLSGSKKRVSRSEPLTIVFIADEDGCLDWDSVTGDGDSAEWFKRSWQDCGVSLIEGYPALQGFEDGDPINAGRTFEFKGNMACDGGMDFYVDDYEEWFEAESVVELPRSES